MLSLLLTAVLSLIGGELLAALSPRRVIRRVMDPADLERVLAAADEQAQSLGSRTAARRDLEQSIAHVREVCGSS